MVNLTINGKEINAPVGSTILEAARSNGIYIPTLCYDEAVEIYGACGLCVVEAQGVPKLLRSCSSKVSEGMVINTESERVVKSRKIAMELLMSAHDGDCVAPCQLACPANTDCQGYVGLIANGKEPHIIKRIFDRIETFLPQSSIVGLLLEHVDDYEVVRSTNLGPLQHDAFSWEIMGGSIIKADGLDKNSVRLDKTLRNWIGGMDEAQRKQFVNVLFSIASDSNFENLDQMSFKQLIEMIKAADELSKADWSMLKDTVRLLISAGVGVVRDEKEK